MAILEWRVSERTDRPLLQGFKCTPDPPRLRGHLSKRRPHPRPWEWIVQTRIHDVSPHSDARAAVLLGFDDKGLAAVVVLGIEEDPGAAMIDAIGVALRHRNTGYAVADEAMEQAFSWALARADEAGLLHVTVTAKRHPRNNASKFLLKRNRFTQYGVDHELEVWRTEALEIDQPRI